jgi:hypothetical protein
MTNTPAERDDDYRPTVADVDPDAMAVNSLHDTERVHGDPTESEIVNSTGEVLPVDEENDGDSIDRPDPDPSRE